VDLKNKISSEIGIGFKDIKVDYASEYLSNVDYEKLIFF
jgi:hypothetical protein